MKKMLVKAVALSLVMGGVGFVSNNAQAYDAITDLAIKAEAEARMAGDKVNADNIATNKDNIQQNAKDIATNKALATRALSTAQKEQLDRYTADVQIREDMKKADKELSDKIDTNAKDIASNKAIATKAYGMAQTEQVERKIADVQIREDMKKADKELSDKIDAETNYRKFGEFKLNTKIDAEGQARVAGDELLNKKIEKETKDREFGEFKLNTKIDAEGQARVAGDELLNKKIEKETKDREFGEFKLNTKIDAEGQARVAGDELLNKKIEKETADRKAEVSRLDSRIDKLDANVEKVGAMAAAIANLHTMGYDPEAPTEIAVGVGQYRDKTGMALGAFHYPNRDFMLSFSVSTAGDEFMGGIGATWKFGRKSPEELRQAEAEKAAKAKLAKAEAAKKAAKDARVAAQQKRHAEMLAARTGK